MRILYMYVSSVFEHGLTSWYLQNDLFIGHSLPFFCNSLLYNEHHSNFYFVEALLLKGEGNEEMENIYKQTYFGLMVCSAAQNHKVAFGFPSARSDDGRTRQGVFLVHFTAPPSGRGYVHALNYTRRSRFSFSPMGART